MLPRHGEPILAVATAPGRGAVGIVRVSGAQLSRFAQALLGCSLAARKATYLPFPDAQGQPIDQGLALYFAAPHSYTGEDVLELQAHGGAVVLQLLVKRCLELAQAVDPATGTPVLPGLRLAQPGEFSERAFLNGKLDLAQAEAVADLIDASTEAAARGASRSLGGEFSAAVQALREALITLRMLVEATLDFPDEDIDFLERDDARGQLQGLQQQLQALLARARQGALLREGMRVVIAGQPNVGKSSLLNALAGAELAIVTPVPGTTRDKVAQTIQIEGVPVHVTDTAGLRDSSDEVERMGIARAWSEIGQADAVLFLRDLSRAGDPACQQADADIAARLVQHLGPRVALLEVWNKADLVGAAAPAVAQETLLPGAAALRISAREGLGLEDLRAQLLRTAGWEAMPEGVFLARERHVQALLACATHLEGAAAQLGAGGPALELVAEELRLAQQELNRITGAFGADALLGVIFARFCIGK